VIFEWHAAKAGVNLAKHGASFELAATAFLDPLSLTFPDLRHVGRGGSDGYMKKASVKRSADELLPEYDLSRLKGGIRGKYHAQAAAGTNLVLIEPELAEVFPDAESVNRALRLLAKTAAAVARPAGRRQGAPKKPSRR